MVKLPSPAVVAVSVGFSSTWTVTPERPISAEFLTKPLKEMGPAAITKGLGLGAVMPKLVTRIVPVIAPGGIVTTSWLAEALTTAACMPLKLTLLFSGIGSKLEPKRVTMLPTVPLSGLKPPINGAFWGGPVVKRAALVTLLPAAVVTVIGPVPMVVPETLATI